VGEREGLVRAYIGLRRLGCVCVRATFGDG
jgi:hypothetical protein